MNKLLWTKASARCPKCKCKGVCHSIFSPLFNDILSIGVNGVESRDCSENTPSQISYWEYMSAVQSILNSILISGHTASVQEQMPHYPLAHAVQKYNRTRSSKASAVIPTLCKLNIVVKQIETNGRLVGTLTSWRGKAESYTPLAINVLMPGKERGREGGRH